MLTILFWLLIVVVAGLVTFGLVKFLYWYFTVPNLPCPSDESVMALFMLAIFGSMGDRG